MQQVPENRERNRTVEAALSFAVGHRVRIEILCLLNEEVYSVQELAAILHQRISTVSHHVEQLIRAGCIEVARTKSRRNMTQFFYRAVTIPFLSDEEMQSLSSDARREIYAAILQASTAEVMASFSAEKITDDPRVMMAWSWFNVDAQGRADIAEEQARSWERIREIEVESAHRRIDSKEPAKSIIVTSLGYERSRSAKFSPFKSGES